MALKQLSVFIENRSGRLANITTTLGEANINIRAMTLTDKDRFGVLRLIVNDVDKAAETLRNLGFSIRITDVVAVEIIDKPGELGRLLNDLGEAGINLDYIYGYSFTAEGRSVLVFHFDDCQKAALLMKKKGMALLED